MSRETIRAIGTSMKESANNLYTLLENLLQWSRMQQGVVSFEPEVFCLSEKILESVEPLLVFVNNKLIDVSYDVPEGINVNADPAMFNTVIRNLFTNAAKFTKR